MAADSGSTLFDVTPGAPVISSVAPTFGYYGGNTNVLLSGSNLATASSGRPMMPV